MLVRRFTGLPITFRAMPSSSQRVVVAAFALFSLCGRPLSAQAKFPRVSVDGAVGAGSGFGGGERVERTLIGTELLVAIQLGGSAGRGFLVGLDDSRDRQLNGDLLCLGAAGGGCIPQYPGFAALVVVGGYQWTWLPAVRVRVLGGPGYYTAYFDRNATTTHSLGLGARTDVAVRLFQRVSATLGMRGAWVPHVRDQSYVPNATMIGLRVEMGG